MATSSRFYSRSRPQGVSAQEEQTRDDRRLNTIESAVHALQQQQSGASAQLSVFNEKLDIMEERIGQRIANTLQERNTNPVQPMYRGRIKVLREASVGCSDRRYLAF